MYHSHIFRNNFTFNSTVPFVSHVTIILKQAQHSVLEKRGNLILAPAMFSKHTEQQIKATFTNFLPPDWFVQKAPQAYTELAQLSI